MNGNSSSVKRYIDFHAHILPNMDDGSSSAKMSLEMLEMSHWQGVGCVVLTPHFYPGMDHPQHFLEKRNRRFNQLISQVNQSEMLLIPGAEVQYYDGMVSMQELASMRIGKSSAILIEMPFCEWTTRMVNDILDIHNRSGYQVILAHIERYLSHQKKNVVNQLLQEGILMQANASFFTDWRTSFKAIHMLKEGAIHLLGSDCHNTTTRLPNVGDAFRIIEKKCGSNAVRDIIKRGTNLILNDVAERHTVS